MSTFNSVGAILCEDGEVVGGEAVVGVVEVIVDVVVVVDKVEVDGEGGGGAVVDEGDKGVGLAT
jgi:hypothetical protein